MGHHRVFAKPVDQDVESVTIRFNAVGAAHLAEEIKRHAGSAAFEEDREESVEGDEGRRDSHLLHGVEEVERLVEEAGVGVGSDQGVEEARVELDGAVGAFLDREEEVACGVEAAGLGEEVEHEEEGVGVVREGVGGGEVVEEAESAGRVGDEA